MAWALRGEEMIAGQLDEVVELLAEVKAAGVPCYALSNMEADRFELRRSRYPFFARFDGCVISGIEGVAKPDPAIFEILLSRFGLDPAGDRVRRRSGRATWRRPASSALSRCSSPPPASSGANFANLACRIRLADSGRAIAAPMRVTAAGRVPVRTCRRRASGPSRRRAAAAAAVGCRRRPLASRCSQVTCWPSRIESGPRRSSDAGGPAWPRVRRRDDQDRAGDVQPRAQPSAEVGIGQDQRVDRAGSAAGVAPQRGGRRGRLLRAEDDRVDAVGLAQVPASGVQRGEARSQLTARAPAAARPRAARGRRGRSRRSGSRARCTSGPGLRARTSRSGRAGAGRRACSAWPSGGGRQPSRADRRPRCRGGSATASYSSKGPLCSVMRPIHFPVPVWLRGRCGAGQRAPPRTPRIVAARMPAGSPGARLALAGRTARTVNGQCRIVVGSMPGKHAQRQPGRWN